MSHVPSAAHELMRSQHGVVSRGQLIEVGLQGRSIEGLVARGDLRPVVRGVYGSPSRELDELARAAAVCLAHPRVAIAGPTAGRLWGFRQLPRDERIHTLAPRCWRSSGAPWCVVYRTDAVAPHDVEDRGDGIRVTSRARTALDLSRFVPQDLRLLSIIEQAMCDGELTPRELDAAAEPWVYRRPWVARFRRVLAGRVGGGAAESDAETRIGHALQLRGVRGLVRQHRVHLPGYGDARFDLALPERQLAIEVDLFPTHRETAGRLADARRDRAARWAGWTVFRISEGDERFRFDEVIDELVAELANRRTA